MTPETWSDVLSYGLLAVGAAMAFGTGMALLTHHRTGLFPGQPIDDDGNPVGEVPLRGAWVRVVLGTIIALWGLAGIVSGQLPGLG